MIEVKLLDTQLSLEECINFVSDDGAGAICSFVGTVRDETKGEKVIRLEFEAYKKMAVSEMKKIGGQAIEKFDIKNIAIHHRTGTLEIGEIPVIIVVSSAHRKASFRACEFAIDTLKETVPIWKKEYLENGEHWVSAHP